MKLIGAHVSAAGGVENAPLNATAIGATAFALFVKNQRQWITPPLTESNVSKFKENMATGGFRSESVLVHDSYLINLGNPDPEKQLKSYSALLDEMHRVKQLDLKYLNIHPGSHLKLIDPKECLKNIASSINKLYEEIDYVEIVLENTAGQGTNLGNSFEEIAIIIEQVKDKSRIGVCIDTCHTFAAGYDLRTEETFEKTMDDFIKTIGFNFLKGMHLNDSLKPFDSRKDRHAQLGQGEIGLLPFKKIMQDKRFDNIPLILETPDNSLYKEEIALLKSFQNQ